MAVSAKTGAGLDGWLEAVLSRSDAGQRIVAVDYDVYAEGEAVLGWLNATVALHAASPDWTRFAEQLLRALSQRFDTLGAAVGHVKLLVSAGAGYVIGNVTGKAETATLRGTAEATLDAVLTLNARVQMSPKALEGVVRDVLTQVCQGTVTAEAKAWRCLSPGRPNPSHRYDHVV